MRLPLLMLVIAAPLLAAWLPELEQEPSLAAALSARELPAPLAAYADELAPLQPLVERGPALFAVLGLAGLAALPFAAVHRRATPAPEPAKTVEDGWEPWF